MPSIRDIFVRLGVKSDPRAMDQANRGFQRIASAAKAAATAFVAFRGVQAIRGFAEETRALGDRLDKVSQQIGLTTDALQELEFAGGLAGVSAEDVSQSLRILARNAREAATGSAEYADDFTAIGVAVTDATGQLKSADVLIEDIAEGMRGLSSDTEKTALAQTLLGRSGSRLIPLLNQGARGIRAQREEARQLGLLNREQIQQAVELTDNQLRLQRAFAFVKFTVAKVLLPAINRITVGITKFIRENRRLIGTRIEEFMRRLGRIASAVGDLFLDIARAVNRWLEGLSPLQRQLVGISKIALTLAAVLLLPGGSILLLIGLMGLLIEDFQTWRRGGESVIGDIIAGFQHLFDVVQTGWAGLLEDTGGIGPAVAAALTEAGSYWARFFGVSQAQVDGFIEALTDSLNNFWSDLLSGWAELFGRFFAFLGEQIASLVRQIPGADIVLRAVQALTSDEPQPARELAGPMASFPAAAATAPGAGLVTLPPIPAAAGATTTNNESSTTNNVTLNVSVPPGLDEDRLAEALSSEFRAAVQNYIVEAP